MHTNKLRRYLFIAAAGLIVGCSSSSPSGRYTQDHDSAPTRLPTQAELRNAVPVPEPHSPQGNRDYEVLGKQYQVMDSAQGFSEEGNASWYGNKFHGHLTSNGEYYDMYSMTAAHTRLPLPTYVKVTNLTNNRHVIVRVNDRGPFHSERIIDLSFAAAYKLDMLDSGTAPVKVEAINLNTPLASAGEKPQPSPHYHIQLVASSDSERLSQIKDHLPINLKKIATTEENNGLHKLVLGPVPEHESHDLLEHVRTNGYPQAFRVKAMQNSATAPDEAAQN